MRSSVIVGPLASIILIACSGGVSPGDVQVRTDRHTHFVPDIASVTVRNDWDENIYLSSCAILERREGGDWVGPAEVACPEDLVALRPGGSHQFVRGLNDATALGTSRFRVPISREGVPFRAIGEAFVSHTFTVAPGAPQD